MIAPWTPIPGETPIESRDGLKIRSITTRTELNRYEAENIQKVVVKYLADKPSRRSAPFDFSWTLKLHKEMFGDVWKWAGKCRTSDVNVGAPWMQVEQKLYRLLGDLAYWEENNSMSLLEQAVRLHHGSVHIHPFLNGNGRWSRMLANIWLKRHDHPITDWPEPRVGERSDIRDEYLIAVKAADAGKLELLSELHRRYTPLA